MGQTANKIPPEAEPHKGAGPLVSQGKLPSSPKELASSAPTGKVLTSAPSLSPSKSVPISPVHHQFRRAMGSRELPHADDTDQGSPTAHAAVRPPRVPPAIPVVRLDNSTLVLRTRRCASSASGHRQSPLVAISMRERNASTSACSYSPRGFTYAQHMQHQSHQHQQRPPFAAQGRRRLAAGGGNQPQVHGRAPSLSLTRINDDSRFRPLREVAAANTVSVPDLTKMPLRSAMKGSRNHSSLSLNQTGNSTPRGSVRLPMTVSVSAHNLCLSSYETPPTPTSITSKLSTGRSTAGVEQNAGGGGGSRLRFRELFHGALLSTSPKRREPVFSPPAREEFRAVESETQRESLFFPNVSNAEDDGGNSGGEDTPPGKKTSHRYSELSTCVESLKPIFEVEGSLDSLNLPIPPTNSPTENCLPPRILVPDRGPGGRKAILSEGSEESIDEAHSLSSNETPGSPRRKVSRSRNGVGGAGIHAVSVSWRGDVCCLRLVAKLQRDTNSEHDGNSDLCPEQLMLRGTVNSLDGQAVLRFYECVSVHEIDSDFPRAAERTWMTLTPLDKALIRRELNEFKRGEMQVHPASFGNTRFHPS